MKRIQIPMKLPSANNLREHHFERRARVEGQRKQVRSYLVAAHGGGRHAPPKLVRMIRHGKSQLDTDNLAGAFKAVRDEIAAFFGVDDGPKGPIRWEVDEGPAKRDRAPYIVIEIE